MLFLLDPSVSIHLSTWHRRITKSFLYHSRPQLALRYMRIKKPPLETPEDVKLRLTVLIANGYVYLCVLVNVTIASVVFSGLLSKR